MKRKVVSYLAVYLSLALILAMMGVVFFFSSEKAEQSSQTSDKVTDMVLTLFVKDFAQKPESEKMQLRQSWSHVVRKCAHFLEYFALGFLVYLHLRFLQTFGKKEQDIRYFGLRVNPDSPLFSISWVLAFAVSLIYACSDEYHQSFIEGRGPQVLDICIDASGAATGIFVLWIVWAIIRQVQLKKDKKGNPES